MHWEGGSETRDGAVMHTPGQPLDLTAVAAIFGSAYKTHLLVKQASGVVLTISTTAEITLEDMCKWTDQTSDPANPFLLQERPAQGKHTTPLRSHRGSLQNDCSYQEMEKVLGICKRQARLMTPSAASLALGTKWPFTVPHACLDSRFQSPLV